MTAADPIWVDFLQVVRQEVERYGADRARYTTPADILTDLQLQAAKLTALIYVLFRRAGELRNEYLTASQRAEIERLRRREAAVVTHRPARGRARADTDGADARGVGMNAPRKFREGERARTISIRRVSMEERRRRRREARVDLQVLDQVGRPQTRAECEDAPRPCPYVGCRYHLALDIGKGGAIKLNFPNGSAEVDFDRMRETCSLDVAGWGGLTLEETGRLLNLTRERTRQLEEMAFDHVPVELLELPDEPEVADVP